MNTHTLLLPTLIVLLTAPAAFAQDANIEAKGAQAVEQASQQTTVQADVAVPADSKADMGAKADAKADAAEKADKPATSAEKKAAAKKGAKKTDASRVDTVEPEEADGQ